MNMAVQKLGLLNQFKDTPQEAASAHQATFRLTPHLVLAAALLHMMASDGVIEDAESSQLQSVIGGDQHVMNVAVQYVQAVPLAQFLTDAFQLLDKASTLCVLTNVCDSLLADGSAGADEVALFERMKTAWGIDTATFAPFERTIALKNNATVMGEYQADQLAEPGGSAHLALAASLLYMMAADGTIATEEIGQLQTVIGEFKGLQEAALKQVRSVKLPEFLKRITPSLSPDVKLYILTNVCDSMMADGDVDALESKIFQTMLTGYGYDNASFKPFYQSIKVKNIKTFSASVLKPKLIYSNVASGNASDEKGVRFNRDNSFQEGSRPDVDPPVDASADGPVISHVLPGHEGVHVGNRTMQDNINKVAQGFGDEDRIHQVQENALADQTRADQKSADGDPNIQTIGGTPGASPKPGPVLQPTPANRPAPHVLNTAAAPVNKALLAPATAGSNPVKLPVTGVTDNAIRLAVSANEDHLEKLSSTQDGTNIQAVPDVTPNINRQPLPKQPAGVNLQAAPKSMTAVNRPAVDADLHHANRANAPAPSLTNPHTAAQKANRLQRLSQNVRQLRLRLEQLAGLNHDVLAAAQQASGGPCINCGNPKCLFTHHINTQTG